jgi:hypothetical protein
MSHPRKKHHVFIPVVHRAAGRRTRPVKIASLPNGNVRVYKFENVYRAIAIVSKTGGGVSDLKENRIIVKLASRYKDLMRCLKAGRRIVYDHIVETALSYKGAPVNGTKKEWAEVRPSERYHSNVFVDWNAYYRERTSRRGMDDDGSCYWYINGYFRACSSTCRSLPSWAR